MSQIVGFLPSNYIFFINPNTPLVCRLEELSKERTKELQVIELERKALLQREKEMDDMVKNLESNLNAQTDRMTNRMESLQDEIEKSKSKDREGAVKEEKGKREKIERNYGTVMARIEKERELIVEEKQALKAKETQILKGGSTEGLDDALEKYLKEMSTNKGQRSQQERIKKLRMQEEEVRESCRFQYRAHGNSLVVFPRRTLWRTKNW